MCHIQHTHESQSRVTSRIFLKVRGGQSRRYNRNLVPRSEIPTCLVSDSDPLFFFFSPFFSYSRCEPEDGLFVVIKGGPKVQQQPTLLLLLLLLLLAVWW